MKGKSNSKIGCKHKGGDRGWINSKYIKRKKGDPNYYYIECDEYIKICLRTKASVNSKFLRITVSNEDRVFIKKTDIHKGIKWFYIIKL